MDRPNILFILSDDHAAEAITAYSDRFRQIFSTPNLDRLAQEGARCDACFCTNALCVPSRASIMTGRYSHQNHVKTLDDLIDPALDTFPKRLHDMGYQTFLVGKWHLHSKPAGFDDFEVLPGQGRYYDPYFMGEDSPFTKEVMYQDDRGHMEEGYVTDLITDKALRYLQNRDPAKPFLLLCHHKAPHDNFEYAKRHEHLLDGKEIPLPDSFYDDKHTRSVGSRGFGGTVSESCTERNMVQDMSRPDYPTGSLDVRGLDPRQRALKAYDKYIRDYLRTVKGIDESVGKLLNYLDDEGLNDNTIVIYASDQGMFLGEHDYFDKRWMFEESMRMPLLVRYPGRIPAGKVVRSMIRNIDFAPTLLDYAGGAMPGCAGISVRAALEGGDAPEPPVYYRYWMHLSHLRVPAHLGVRTRTRKLIFFYGLPLGATNAVDEVTPCGVELYDLEKDPLEMHNVYHDPAYADDARAMRLLLRREKERAGDVDMDAEFLRRYHDCIEIDR